MVECFKDGLLLSIRNSDPSVDYAETNLVMRIVQRLTVHSKPHRAVGSELQCVVAKVIQDLPQAVRVPSEGFWQIRRYLAFKMNTLLLRARTKEGATLIHHGLQGEINRLGIQFAGLNLGKIQHIVKQIH